MRKIAARPVVVVVDRQAEVAVLAEANAPVVIQLMADEEAAAGNRVEAIATARAGEVGVVIAIEREVAVQHLQAASDLRAWQVAQACRVAGDGRRALGPGRSTGVGQADIIGADFVEHDAARMSLLAAQREYGAGGQGASFYLHWSFLLRQ